MDQLISGITVSSGSTDLSNYYTKTQTNANFLSANTSISASPAGSNLQIQYNSAGTFAASSNFTYNNSTKALTLNGDIYIGKTTSSNLFGVIYKSGVRFIHDYAVVGSNGYNLFIGEGSGNFTLTTGGEGEEYFGSENLGVGAGTLNGLTIGSGNVAIGADALSNVTEGAGSVAIGGRALRDLTIGYGNVAIGGAAGMYMTTGYGNILIGSSAGQNETGNNKLYIENSSSSKPMIGGDFGSRYVSIDNKLRLNGATSGYITLKTTDAANSGLTFTLPNNAGSNNQVLTTDGAGNLSFTNKLALSDEIYAINATDYGTKIGFSKTSGFSYLPTINTDADVIYFALSGVQRAYVGNFLGSTAFALKGSGDGFVGIKAPNVSSNYLFTLPSNYGTADQVLTTDGNGNLSFTNTINSAVFVTTGTTQNISGAKTFTEFTKFGSNAPAIKFIKITGTTASTTGTTVGVSVDLNGGKVIGFDLNIEFFTKSGVGANFTGLNNYQATVYHQHSVGINTFYVKNVEFNSSLILSKPFSILISYE